MSVARFLIFISFVTFGILPRHCSMTIKVLGNKTRIHENDNVDDLGLDLTTLETSAALRERFRRLIPYMTYYLVNNYVQQPQQPLPSAALMNHQAYMKSQILEGLRGPTTTGSGQYVTSRPVTAVQIADKNRYQALQKLQEDRFVPSVQYDPKDSANQDVDYFVPVRYRPTDYAAVTMRTTRPMPIPTPNEAHYPTTRPVSFLKPVTKPQGLQDYSSYANFESVRFAKPHRVHQHQHQQQPPQSTTRYVGTAPAVRPSLLAPRVNINHVLKSLQLTSRLPEVLNNDNIDSSIRTLEEILRILNAGKDSYAPVYEKYKPMYTKPKVITESNYEATQIGATPAAQDELLVEMKPAPVYVSQVKTQLPLAVMPQDDLVSEKPSVGVSYLDQLKTQIPVKIKPTGDPYIDRDKIPMTIQQGRPQTEEQQVVVEIKPKSPYAKAQNPSTTPEPQKIIEYYVPIVQDIDEEKMPIEKGPSVPQNTEHSIDQNDYNVAQQGNDDILEYEKHTLPVSSEEAPVQKLTTNLQNIQPLLKYGATRGKPHIDYPAYTEIPETDFSCKQQRYKGFFGDPATGCQVWHYCDLNGGKSSFLCPNGTIFSQVSLTCDWWFNVKCESTTQLYVLNERLYKYILPIMPKFPEDFTGPEVDKYLELKFKEMEAKMKEKKKKKEQEEEKDKNTINTLQSIEDSK